MPSIINNNNREIKITNVSTNLKEDLGNIAKNLGVDLAAFLKTKLHDIASSYPEDMKRKKPDF